jgi:threonine aldolase
MKEIIDLRSDTVTQPTPEMRQAMAEAVVGDDVYGEDPTVNRLETLSAEILGKEAGLFVPSGTMGNLAAVLAHCGRGDEVILGHLSHTFLYEAGGISALGGVHPRTIQNQEDGTLKLEDIENAVRPDNPHFPISRLVILENTHNRTGGTVLSAAYTRDVAKIARRNHLYLHLDGARIFNAAVAAGLPARELAEPADSVTFCLSKALCAPVGSVLCGTEPFIHKARRVRKQLGGGMRQAGILAAAGIVALEKMIDRLSEDHQRARKLAEGIEGLVGLVVEKDPPPSNMVYLTLEDELPLTSYELADHMRGRSVLIGAVSERRIRMVLHYWIRDEDVEFVIKSYNEMIKKL